MSTITIDNKAYQIADLSDQAKKELASLQTAQASIQKANEELAILNVARKAYEAALIAKLPEQSAPAEQEENVLLINFNKYDLGSLSEEAKAQLNMRTIVERKITNQVAELAMLQTAYNAYLEALKSLV